MTNNQPLLLKNCKIVDVDTISTLLGDIYINNGLIQEIDPRGTLQEDTRIIDLQGKYASPGFIEAHMHIESSMMPPLEFAHYSVKHGTTTMLVDPHEIANVMGLDGIHFMLENAALTPFKIFFGAPSCVPATPFVGHMSEESQVTLRRFGVFGVKQTAPRKTYLPSEKKYYLMPARRVPFFRASQRLKDFVKSWKPE